MSRCLAIAPEAPQAALLQEAVCVLQQGGVVAYPTDTVYGLAVDATNVAAIARLFTAKQRPGDKAIPLIIGDRSQLSQVAATILPGAERLMQAFWPGPLTLLFEPQSGLPAELRGSSACIGVRWPAALIGQHLACMLGRPITATSANRSGASAALTAPQVMAQLSSSVDLILDGGTASSAEVSTVLDVSVVPPRFLRAGKISSQAIESVLRIAIRSAPMRHNNRLDNALYPEDAEA
ncbi:MAG TPA: L-threonylcarbamoyladenylate synthase [Candidatus Entotheonella sp.]